MADKVALLSAGGTGGHLFPAEALAHELVARGWQVDLATDSRVGNYVGNFPAREIHAVASATPSGRNPLSLASAGWTIWRGVRQTSAIIRRIEPAVVVGFGGYPTLPPLYAATRRGVPSLIHEQNAVMGRANRALAGRVTAIAGGFLPEGGAFSEKTVVTGNPVRPAVIAAAGIRYRPSGPGESFHLLVFGGSQGARFFSDAVPEAVAALDEEKRGRLKIVQQARPEDEARVKAAYSRLGVEAKIAPFFTDMAARLARASLVVSRSGASTVSEISAIGRPAILVPYPHALDHDQAANAAALASAGGAEVRPQADFDAATMARLLAALMDEPGRLADMAAAAKSVGRPDAARLLADLTEAIASGASVAEFWKGMPS